MSPGLADADGTSLGCAGAAGVFLGYVCATTVSLGHVNAGLPLSCASDTGTTARPFHGCGLGHCCDNGPQHSSIKEGNVLLQQPGASRGLSPGFQLGVCGFASVHWGDPSFPVLLQKLRAWQWPRRALWRLTWTHMRTKPASCESGNTFCFIICAVLNQPAPATGLALPLTQAGCDGRRGSTMALGLMPGFLTKVYG